MARTKTFGLKELGPASWPELEPSLFSLFLIRKNQDLLHGKSWNLHLEESEPASWLELEPPSMRRTELDLDSASQFFY